MMAARGNAAKKMAEEKRKEEKGKRKSMQADSLITEEDLVDLAKREVRLTFRFSRRRRRRNRTSRFVTASPYLYD